MNKYLIIDKFTLTRESTAALIYEIQSDAVVYEADSLQEAKNISTNYKEIDCIIFNSTFTQMDHITYMAQLSEFNKDCKKLIITKSSGAEKTQYLLENGADCTVSANSTRNQICSAIRSLNTQTSTINDSTTQVGHSSAMPCKNSKKTLPQTSHEQDQQGRLTTRQKEVLNYMTKGYANKLIAYELGISEGTIKLHVSSILRALNVTNRTEAAMRASQYLTSNARYL